jgi:hypothetical protein
MEKWMTKPGSAALFAAAMTAMAVYITREKGEKKQFKNSEIAKPALFVGILVYFIVYNGTGSKFEQISKEPF